MLQEWIAVKSIAAENIGMAKGCEKMRLLALDAGFQRAECIQTKGHPGVFATLDAGARRTLGLYFMYDVKQVTGEEWSSPPWDARLIDMPDRGKVVMGRGAVNQKGPQAAFLAALHAIRGAGAKLPVNLVLVAEGEEELGSPHLSEILRNKKVEAALKKTKGIVMPGAAQDLDGVVWTAVDSPTWRLVKALSTMVSDDGNTILIDGVTDGLRPTSDTEKQLLDEVAAKSDDETEKKTLGVDRWIDDLDERAMLERMVSQPS